MQEGFMRIWDQCCDADYYMHIGYKCAKAGECFDPLRPVGTSYWFSVPFFIDAKQPAEVIFLLQFAVLSCLILLSFFIFWDINRRLKGRMDGVGLVGWLLAIGAWAFYLYPTFFNTLSDTPASVLFVGGFLMLIAAAFRDSASFYFFGGLLLGLSAIVRTSYFNPIIFGFVGYLSIFMFLLIKKRKEFCFRDYRKSIFILSCFIPFSAQYISNYKNFGYFSFVASDYSRLAMEFHLESVTGGYDTVLPQGGYYWSPVCSNATGLKKDLMKGNFSGAACVLVNRARFYLGSYAANTYLGESDRDFVDYGYAEQVGFAGPYGVYQMDVALADAMSPAGKKTASYLRPNPIVGDGSSYVETSSIMPLPEGDYAVSIFLWSDEHALPSLRVSSISVLGKERTEGLLLLEKELSLNKKPEEFSFTFQNTKTGYLVLQLGYFDSGKNTQRMPFYAWGVKLEPAGQAIGYVSKRLSTGGVVGVPAFPAESRIFSWWLLLANVLSLCLAMVMLQLCWKKTQAPVIIFIMGCFLGVFAQSLLVVPEQRFVQPVLMVSWLLGCLLISSSYPRIAPVSPLAVKF